MGQTFAEKFEKALEERRERDPGFGLRTLARNLAKGDPDRAETIRRRLNKYRPKPGNGGSAEVAPTEPSRREIERAMGLDVDALAPDKDAVAALAADREFLEDVRPLRRLWEIGEQLERGELQVVKS